MGACSHGANYAKCPKGMTKAQMRDFAATKEKGLPMKKKQMGGVIGGGAGLGGPPNGMLGRGPKAGLGGPPRARLGQGPRAGLGRPPRGVLGGGQPRLGMMKKGGVAKPHTYSGGGVATCGKLKDHGGFAELGIGK